MPTLQEEQARIADDIEAAAFRDTYPVVPADLAAMLSLRTEQIGPATLLLANVNDPIFSRAIGLGNDGRCDDAEIDGVIDAYRSAGVNAFWIHINPVLAPRELVGKLEARAFKLATRRTWAKMVRTTSALPDFETPLTVREANAREQVGTSAVIAAAFGMPPPFARWIENIAARPKWTMVMAHDGERIVGGGLLYVDGQHAWLGLGGVVAEARRRNAHRAILATRIAIAIKKGCTHVVTETGEPVNNEPNPSLRNMYRLGFERVASRLNYLAPQFK